MFQRLFLGVVSFVSILAQVLPLDTGCRKRPARPTTLHTTLDDGASAHNHRAKSHRRCCAQGWGHPNGRATQPASRPACSQPASKPASAPARPPDSQVILDSRAAAACQSVWHHPATRKPARARQPEPAHFRQWGGWGGSPKLFISSHLACANLPINLTQSNDLVN